MSKFNLSNRLLLQNIKVIHDIEYPQKFLFPVKQGAAKTSRIVVNRGNIIRRGDLLAQGTDGQSVDIHSSVGGVVF